MNGTSSALNAQIMGYQPSHSDGVRALFVEVNRELTPPGMEERFAAYVECALREEIANIGEYFDPRRGNGFWTTLAGNDVIGFFGLERKDSKAVELRRMYLAKKYHGSGLAQRMLDRAVTEARNLDYRVLELSTADIQRRAISFYRRNGFREVRTEYALQRSHKTIGGGMRRIFFEKDLTCCCEQRRHSR
jgi:GNAT superfamily N-acetyltransferase